MEPSYVRDVLAVNELIDGSTFIITVDLGFGLAITRKIRLVNIKCHEVDTPQGRESRDFVKSIIDGRRMTVKIFPDRFKKYSTLLGVLFIKVDDGYINLNDELIKQSFAWYIKDDANNRKV